MATLTRISTKRGRAAKLADGGHVGMGSRGPNGVRIDFGYACEEIDRRYSYSVHLSHHELARLITQCASGDIAQRLSPDEHAQWLELTVKALGKRET